MSAKRLPVPPDPALFDFELPPDCIAQRPNPRRDAAKLMVLDRSAPDSSAARHLHVRDLPELLRAGDLLVVNTTRVLPARLRGRKQSGGVAEALLLGPASSVAAAAVVGAGRPAGPGSERGCDSEAASQAPSRSYRALVKTNGRLRVGLRFEFERGASALGAELVALGDAGEVVLEFEPGPSPYSLGEAPLPPYIRRSGANQEEFTFDLERYQTVFAKVEGAVAAPTAGLHLTAGLLEKLRARGVESAEVVLHVGAGTFRPLGEDQLRDRRLHSESFELSSATADAVARTRARGGRVVAVGTTTTRVLESCATSDRGVEAGSGETQLFLYPGCELQVVDALLTNFHLPRSSLLYLVAAFVGRERVLAAYREAIEMGYRFYSYGDAMLIL